LEYGDFIERTVAECYDPVSLRPWRFDRLERAWLLHAARRGAELHRVAAGRVYRDLRAAISRRTRNPLWLAVRAPALAYVVFQALRAAAAWRIWARAVGPRRLERAPGVAETSQRALPPPGERLRPPLASVVVLSHDRLAYLRTTVESLYATADPELFELIVVDNGSTDGSADYLRELARRGAVDKVILRARNHGTSPGFNVGFAHADPRSRLLIKLDSDIVLLQSGWLERLDAFLGRDSRLGAAALSQINHGLLRWAPRQELHGEQVSSWNWFVCGGACMTIPRRVLDDVGWLNEEFDTQYMPDDLDYAMRLSLLGYEAYYLQDLTSYHRADLDHRLYRRHGSSKRRQRRRIARRQEHEMYARYASGEASPRLRYARYEGCRFPDGERVLVID
jgi:GT2 family glycosyltransferase